MRRVLLGVLGFGALIVSPQIACMTAAPSAAPVATRKVVEIDRAAEFRPLVEGVWSYRLMGDRGPEIRFRISQSSRPIFQEDFLTRGPSVISSAYACNDTLLIRSASACVHAWIMPLDIEILDAPDSPPIPADQLFGLLTVEDMRPYRGSLQIKFGKTRTHAHLKSDGTVVSAYLKRVDRAQP